MDGVKLIEDNLKLKPNTNTAKSAILFLGDGMGISTITATRFLVGQSKGKQGEETVLSWELFPWTALAKTYAVNLQGTDSASSATAFLNGIKTNEGTFIKKYLGGKWYTNFVSRTSPWAFELPPQYKSSGSGPGNEVVSAQYISAKKHFITCSCSKCAQTNLVIHLKATQGMSNCPLQALLRWIMEKEMRVEVGVKKRRLKKPLPPPLSLFLV